MTDVVDKATRSRMMAGIRGKNTKPELQLRRLLHRAGFRYRIHANRLPGKPDLVFKRYNAVILVHGCFWHKHPGCRWATTPASNSEFWKEKLQKNVDRDIRNIAELRSLGWRVCTVWECALRQISHPELGQVIGSWLLGEAGALEVAFESSSASA